MHCNMLLFFFPCSSNQINQLVYIFFFSWSSNNTLTPNNPNAACWHVLSDLQMICTQETMFLQQKQWRVKIHKSRGFLWNKVLNGEDFVSFQNNVESFNTCSGFQNAGNSGIMGILNLAAEDMWVSTGLSYLVDCSLFISFRIPINIDSL